MRTIYVTGTDLFDRIRDLRVVGMSLREALDMARKEQNWEYSFDTNLRIWRWMIRKEISA
jgi:hypothetical protein